MEATIRKWGNSPAIRLPAKLIKAAAFQLDQKVSVSASGGKIIIEALETVEYRLEELLQDISPANSHDEFSFGNSSGKASHE
jgi:antitoxin MazE